MFSQALVLTKKHGVMTMTTFTSVIWSYLLKIFRYDEIVNWICVFGTLLIVGGIYKIVIK